MGQRPPTWEGHAVKNSVLPMHVCIGRREHTMRRYLFPRPLVHRNLNTEDYIHPSRHLCFLTAVYLSFLYLTLVVNVKRSLPSGWLLSRLFARTWLFADRPRRSRCSLTWSPETAPTKSPREGQLPSPFCTEPYVETKAR